LRAKGKGRGGGVGGGGGGGGGVLWRSKRGGEVGDAKDIGKER